MRNSTQIQWQPILWIAWRELKAKTFSVPFWIGALLTPILLWAILFQLSQESVPSTQPQCFIVIDETGQLETKTITALQAKGLAAFRSTDTNSCSNHQKVSIILRPSEGKTLVQIYSEAPLPSGLEESLENAVWEAQYGSSVEAITYHTESPSPFESQGLVYLFAVFIALSFFNQFIMKSFEEDKQRKIVEILVSSCGAFATLTGKLFGIVGVMIVQWLVTAGFASILYQLLGHQHFAFESFIAFSEGNPTLFVLAFAYFLAMPCFFVSLGIAFGLKGSHYINALVILSMLIPLITATIPNFPDEVWLLTPITGIPYLLVFYEPGTLLIHALSQAFYIICCAYLALRLASKGYLQAMKG